MKFANMNNRFFSTGMILILLMFISPTVWSAKGEKLKADEPIITQVLVNETDNTLTISGSNFGTETTPVVTLGSDILFVESTDHTADMIIASFTSISEGDYLLLVSMNDGKSVVSYNLTVGAVGPTGAKGDKGDQGEPGEITANDCPPGQVVTGILIGAILKCKNIDEVIAERQYQQCVNDCRTTRDAALAVCQAAYDNFVSTNCEPIPPGPSRDGCFNAADSDYATCYGPIPGDYASCEIDCGS